MPLYDYQCQNCGKAFEVLRPFSRADEPAICPDCQSPAQRLMPTSFSVFSKSWSGWLTRVQGTDSPWRTAKKELAETAEGGQEKEPSTVSEG